MLTEGCQSRMRNIFGENLKRIREEKGISQETLANAIGVCRTDISKWENGKRYPQLIWVYEIAGKLDIPIEDLICDK